MKELNCLLKGIASWKLWPVISHYYIFSRLTEQTRVHRMPGGRQKDEKSHNGINYYGYEAIIITLFLFEKV